MEEISIELYQDWMKDQVVELFCKEYGEEIDQFDTYFTSFYGHSFQRDKCIMVVALDGKKVAGFQSYFYWPLNISGRKSNSFQSGNSLVHPDYRGKGIFRKLLNYINELAHEKNVQFLIGFPVEASYNSFMKSGWKNPFNLKWHIKVINVFAPIRCLLSRKSLDAMNAEILEDSNATSARKVLESDFEIWRRGFRADQTYAYAHEEGGKHVIFEFKLVIRKKVIGEVVIGRIVSNSDSEELLKRGLKSFMKRAKKVKGAMMVSCAIHAGSGTKISQLISSEFKLIDKQIYFIVKPMNDSFDEANLNEIDLFRGDIDTW